MVCIQAAMPEKLQLTCSYLCFILVGPDDDDDDDAHTLSSTPSCMQLLSLVKSLRDTGHFTAVSVTRPFEFEGQRKVEAADRMIAALEGAAHLVVVVEQVTASWYPKIGDSLYPSFV